MAFTKITKLMTVIASLGTKPQDRPLTTDQFKAKFDEESESIKGTFNTLIDDMLATTNGKGASQIGIEDSATRYTATNVETALAEIAGSGRTTETVKSLADLISTDVANLATHKAEDTSTHVYTTRNISLTGTQTITLPFHAKNITVNASVASTQKVSWGMCDDSMNQSATALQGASGYQGVLSIVAELSDGINVSYAAVTAINDTSITLTWTKIGSPTGTADIFINATTH